MAVCGVLDRWAPAVEDIVTICETLLTATTSWSSFGVGGLCRWAPAIEDIVTIGEAVLTLTTAWPFWWLILAARVWATWGASSFVRSGTASGIRAAIDKCWCAWFTVGGSRTWMYCAASLVGCVTLVLLDGGVWGGAFALSVLGFWRLVWRALRRATELVTGCGVVWFGTRWHWNSRFL